MSSQAGSAWTLSASPSPLSSCPSRPMDGSRFWPAWQTHFLRPPFVKPLLPLLVPEPVSCTSSGLGLSQPQRSVPVPSMGLVHSWCSGGVLAAWPVSKPWAAGSAEPEEGADRGGPVQCGPWQRAARGSPSGSFQGAQVPEHPGPICASWPSPSLPVCWLSAALPAVSGAAGTEPKLPTG